MTDKSLTAHVYESGRLLSRLIAKGDQLAIVSGRLLIISASGKEVPATWLDKHKEELLTEILKLTKQNGFMYDSYTAGNYSTDNAGKASGVTLQFINLSTSQSAYTVFNAELTRARKTRNKEAGTPLPSGQFRVTKKFYFYKFWQATGLKFPPRLCAFHDYMGNLKDLLFTATLDTSRTDGRLEKTSITPLNITYEQIKTAYDSHY